METQQLNETAERVLRTSLIRDLVERYPEAMPVLSQYGIDVCCGGGLTVPDAASAHGHDPEEVVQAVVTALVQGTG